MTVELSWEDIEIPVADKPAPKVTVVGVDSVRKRALKPAPAPAKPRAPRQRRAAAPVSSRHDAEHFHLTAPNPKPKKQLTAAPAGALENKWSRPPESKKIELPPEVTLEEREIVWRDIERHREWIAQRVFRAQQNGWSAADYNLDELAYIGMCSVARVPVVGVPPSMIPPTRVAPMDKCGVCREPRVLFAVDARSGMRADEFGERTVYAIDWVQLPCLACEWRIGGHQTS